jgi:hypothetical protein
VFVGDRSYRFAHGIDSKVVIDRDHNLREVNGTIYLRLAEPDRQSGLSAAPFWFVCKAGDSQHNPSAAWGKFCFLKDLNL